MTHYAKDDKAYAAPECTTVGEPLSQSPRSGLTRSHYQILWLISEGKTTRQVMELTGYSRGWIQQLARR
jgi:DNA-binding CsgD family transcriptional regulator